MSVRLERTERNYGELHDRIDRSLINNENFRKEMTFEFRIMRGEINDIRAEMKDMRGELNDIRAEMKDMRSEINDMRAEIKDMRGEINDIRAEIKDMRAEINDIRAEMKDLRAEMNHQFSELRMEIIILAKAVTNGFTKVEQRLDALEARG